MGAICLTDYYLISKGAIDIPALSDPQQRYGFWNLYAITLYIVGVLIQLPFIENPLFHGSLTWIFAGNDVSWIIGWFGTGVLYYALRRFDRRSLPAQSLPFYLNDKGGVRAACRCLPAISRLCAGRRR